MFVASERFVKFNDELGRKERGLALAETFSEVADRTIGQNMEVQPTLEIRPGYIFNVLVDQDLVFPKAF